MMNNHVRGQWFILSALLLCSGTTVLAQTTHRIPSDFATLQAAVDHAQNGDTLFLETDVHIDSTNITGKTLVLTGDRDNWPEIQAAQYGIALRLYDAHVECYNMAFTELPLPKTPLPRTTINCENSTLVVRNCSFHDVNLPIDGEASTITVSHSEFRDISGGAAIRFNDGSYIIHNNVMYNFRWSGISCSQSHGAIFNNTIVGRAETTQTGISSFHEGIRLVPDDTVYVFNNIINNFNIGIALQAEDASQLHTMLQQLQVHHNNIGRVSDPYSYTYMKDNVGIHGWFTPSPGTEEQRNTPRFLDAEKGNYNVDASSPCINNGYREFPVEVQYDFAGNPRWAGTAPDIGAFESDIVSSVTDAAPHGADLQIYPMPITNQLFAHLPTEATGTARIVDATGRVVQHTSFANQRQLSFDTHFAAGTYFLILTTDKGVLRQAFIKQ